MLTKDDLAAIEKLLKPIRDSIEAIKGDIFEINSNKSIKGMMERSADRKLGAIQYELEKMKEKLDKYV